MRKAILALVMFLGACAARQSYDYSKEPDPRRNEYVIGVSDHLAITVWKNPELSREVTVRPDGTITMPLIGDLAADGRTPTQLKEEITKQLSKYLRGEGMVVSIAVSGVNSYSFTVSGNVERPGVFSSQKYVTVVEAIQLAGGPNRFASPGKTKLMRRGRDGKTRVIPIDYEAVLEGKQPEANLALVSGDQIFVP
jgi:polysaccharide export outer membrane protein